MAAAGKGKEKNKSNIVLLELNGDLRRAVKLPEGEESNEWLAANVTDFVHHVNLLYGALTEYCTAETCPVMTAGPRFEYQWEDNGKYLKLSAPDYIDNLTSWVSKQLEDEKLFPTKNKVPFPKEYLSNIKTIFKRIFRIYAHIYHSHYSKVVALGYKEHYFTSLKHFIFFVQEFQLIAPAELAPLEDLVKAFAEEP